ncbi:MAG: oligoendopeptidase F [Lachnospiraceae bacterium]|nr:oligoendopeptidase F [Lachnospiraceae bacterium]
MSAILKREDVKKENTWALEDIYASDDLWEKELEELNAICKEFSSYEGHLTDSAEMLYNYLTLSEKAEKLFERIYIYANQALHVDMNNSKYQDFAARANTAMVQLQSVTAFSTPELLSVDESVIRGFMTEMDELKLYETKFERIFKEKTHILSKEEETLLASVSEVAGAAGDIFTLFANADLKFDQIPDENGNMVEMSNSRYITFLTSPDRNVRIAAFKSMYKACGQFKNTLAATYSTNAKKASFYAKTRKYAGSLEASLEPNSIPVAVYDNLIDAIHTHLPKMYKYVSLRKKALGVDELHMYDVYVPMIADADKKISYEEAKATVLEALAPMGEDYLAILKEGFENRWIDVYENEGKKSGAYSWGPYGTHPYVLLNHNDNIDSMFTLAHEMGHALHSYYSNKTQPYTYASYELSVAEVASTCNESLLIHHLLKKCTDKKERAYLINHFLDNFKGTIFRQTMFAEFERITHKMADNGEALTADKLCEIYYDLNKLYFGPDMVSDEEIKYEWSRIPHFYTEFYVYQYATGFSAAIALSKRIMELGEEGVKDYMKFLTGGSSKDPIDLLKMAGVDMSTPDPINAAMDMFGQLVDELETLI